MRRLAEELLNALLDVFGQPPLVVLWDRAAERHGLAPVALVTCLFTLTFVYGLHRLEQRETAETPA